MTASVGIRPSTNKNLYLDTPIQYVKGVGPKLGEVFYQKGIQTVHDLIYCFPRTYEDRRAARNIQSLQADEVVSLRAQIVSVRTIPLGKARRVHDVLVKDGT